MKSQSLDVIDVPVVMAVVAVVVVLLLSLAFSISSARTNTGILLTSSRFRSSKEQDDNSTNNLTKIEEEEEGEEEEKLDMLKRISKQADSISQCVYGPTQLLSIQVGRYLPYLLVGTFHNAIYDVGGMHVHI